MNAKKKRTGLHYSPFQKRAATLATTYKSKRPRNIQLTGRIAEVGLTAQPSQDNPQIERKQRKLAMSVGNSRHDMIEDISGRHFIPTAERAGLPEALAREALAEIANVAVKAMNPIEVQLPPAFPEAIHFSVKRALLARLRND